MHPHHKRALDKARADFKSARDKMKRETKAVNALREFMVVREKTNDYQRSVFRYQLKRALEAIEDYLAQGEILVCVERMLEKA